ncbi:class I SAM-dependent methyltransferase [Herbaspirillum sp. YR522]|uniref:class I SAM-dependent methyltransferase n=1 Tax=Herbaspirillum sp. YR522 TaxID=1144342 RepID=UPI00026FAA91|nr:class I SAM-dependent methyltransferase [Herbaspirillum sp. YR522]EJN09793.1 methyltransferase family protein [Herbaspirillum sp. YR522]
MNLTCPLCGGSNFDTLGSVPFFLEEVLREHTVLGCQTCGHTMVDLRMVDDELIRQLYARPLDEEIWGPGGNRPYVEMIEFARDALAEVMQRPTPLIADFGYGQGYVLGALRDDFGVPPQALVGYDFVPLPVAGITTEHRNLGQLDEHAQVERHFDLAFCCHVLEHIPDPRRLLRGLYRHAGPGSYLYLETPDHALINKEILTGSNQICPQHLHYFTADRLAALAASCGWTVVRQEVSQFEFVPRAQVLLSRDGRRDAREATRTFLGYRDGLRGALTQSLLAASESAQVAAWGAGTDLLLAVAANAELAQRIDSGRIVPYDRERAGAMLGDAVIQPSDLLVQFAGTIVVTPRPVITRFSMVKAARRLGVDARVLDPYSLDDD